MALGCNAGVFALESRQRGPGRSLESHLKRSKRMKKLIVVAAFVATGVTVISAWAGYKGNFPVYVNTSSRVAGGALSSARNSADTIQSLGCAVWSLPGTRYAQCYAEDASGTYVSCMTTDASMIATASTVTGDSTLDFDWDVNHNCTYLSVEQQSYVAPKNP